MDFITNMLMLILVNEIKVNNNNIHVNYFILLNNNCKIIDIYIQFIRIRYTKSYAKC